MTRFSFVRIFAVALLLALFAGSAFAAPKKSQVNEYPNATRKEPKVSISDSSQRALNKAVEQNQDEKYDEALASAQKVIDDSRASPYAKAFAHQLQGSVLYSKDDNEGALKQFQAAAQMDALPNATQFQVLYQIAQLQVMDEKYPDALVTLNDYVKLSGKQDPQSIALRGNIEYRLEKYQDAINSMKQAIAQSDKPNDSWQQILMASYAELDQYGEAAKVMEGELAKDPTNKKLMNQLASIYINDDKPQKAIALMESAKAKGLIDTNDDYLQLAKLYAVADQPKQAAATLKDGMAKGTVQPSFDAYKLLGDVCVQAQDDSCAVDAYTKASPQAQDGNVDYQLGYLLFYSDRSSDAKAALDRAISKGGLRQEGEAYLLRGDVENDMEQGSAALADWQKAAGFASTKAMAQQRINARTKGVKIRKATKN